MITPDLIIAFLTLTFLEVVLGVDNIIFISILSGRFPIEQRKKLMQIGLFLAMIMRVLLLMGVNWLTRMQNTLIHFDSKYFSSNISIQTLILLAGGLFLIYKSTHEIFEKVEMELEEDTTDKKPAFSFSRALFQIVLIDIVFSFDSILTAVGMTNGIPYALWIMIAAVVIAITIMIGFADPVSRFVNKHPSLQILGLSFLLLIGFMLITEAASLSETVIIGSTISTIPKGYLYFAIAFSLGVEMLNMRIKKVKRN
ncbi:TerC family protein [Flavobacteriaceae bacterium]|nr:TerC family protein [Flavobacteriaceae bacterium]MDC0874428.1 TerC family protein [Flavobacteriaceae bacterium]MDC3259546.1 TerC family protein [Flavobacteriaceae bacterium]